MFNTNVSPFMDKVTDYSSGGEKKWFFSFRESYSCTPFIIHSFLDNSSNTYWTTYLLLTLYWPLEMWQWTKKIQSWAIFPFNTFQRRNLEYTRHDSMSPLLRYCFRVDRPLVFCKGRLHDWDLKVASFNLVSIKIIFSPRGLMPIVNGVGISQSWC